MHVGLTEQEAASRRQIFGPNTLESEEEVWTSAQVRWLPAYDSWSVLQESFAWKFIMQFKEPLILLLLGSAVLSLIVGQV